MKNSRCILPKKKSDVLFRLLFVFSFLSYICTLIHVTLFKYVPINELFSDNRWFYVQAINYIPFVDWNLERGGLIRDIILNIVLFFPLGFFLQMINTLKRLNFFQVFIPFVVSILIEIFQYIFSVGVTDITDIICNVLGSVLGGLSYYTFNVIFRKNVLKANKILLLFIGLFAMINLCTFI